jgi:hypothetical protein
MPISTILKGRFIFPLLAFAILIIIFGLYRESLIPRKAEGERKAWLLTGDEPTYLLMAESIACGNGLNVGPVHERGDYLRFQDRPVLQQNQYTWGYYYDSWLIPLIDHKAHWKNSQRPPFTPLLPVVISPFIYHTSNIRWLVAVFQSVLVAGSCFIALLIFSKGARWETRAIEAALGIALFGSLPLAYYTTQIFPEALAGSLVFLFYLSQKSNNRWIRLLGILALSGSMFATPRVCLGVGAVFIFFLTEMIRRRRFLEPILLGAGGLVFLAFNVYTWNSLFPPMGTSFMKNFLGPVLGVASGAVPQHSILRGILLAYYGCDVGIFFSAPLTFMALVSAVYVAYRERTRDDAIWWCLYGGIMLAVSLYSDYRAGTCPAGRYVVIPSFLLLIPLIRMLPLLKNTWHQRFISASLVLGGIGLVIGFSVMNHPNWWYRSYLPLFGRTSIQSYYEWLPDVANHLSYMKLIAWTSVFTIPWIIPDILRGLRFVMLKVQKSIR